MAFQPATEVASGRADGSDGRVTVAVITRDRPASVLRTLDALAALPERPRVIVVDNGSDDATRAAVRRHPADVRILTPRGNTGAVGRNLAVRHADTPYVAFSDDDSWWTPGALRQAADLLDTHPRLGLLAARTLVGAERAEDPLNAVLAASPLPAEPDLPGRPVLGFLGCACVVRKDAFLTAGGYHPLLFFGGEETLLAYDLAAGGWGVTYESSLTAHHHPDPAGRAGRSPLERRNEVLTLWLRRPLGFRAEGRHGTQDPGAAQHALVHLAAPPAPAGPAAYGSAAGDRSAGCGVRPRRRPRGGRPALGAAAARPGAAGDRAAPDRTPACPALVDGPQVRRMTAPAVGTRGRGSLVDGLRGNPGRDVAGVVEGPGRLACTLLWIGSRSRGAAVPRTTVTRPGPSVWTPSSRRASTPGRSSGGCRPRRCCTRTATPWTSPSQAGAWWASGGGRRTGSTMAALIRRTSTAGRPAPPRTG
ncbi:hypothetical protein GCM10010276_52420 [Streptomyces longisporus]|uniref:Glycosyltransferase 2-like domain-containing protein n=1 Tax=Streptomyces longisporus TaxID=1948 RepID=A0ABP5ZV15_STRLO